jgi:hypothetical protein
LESSIEIGTGSHVANVSDIAYAPVPLRKFQAYIRCPVRRSIIGDDKFEIAEILIEDRLNRIGQEILAVVDG